MRILMLCNKPPYPPKDGGSLAMYTMVRGLLQTGHYVKVMAVNAPKFGSRLEDVPYELRKQTDMEFINVNLSKNPVFALTHLLRGKSYQLNRFYNASFAGRLKTVLKEGFDIVQLETVFPAVYLGLIRNHTQARIVLRAHNIENLIWEQLAKNEKQPLRKWYLKKVAQSLKDFEVDLFSKVDGIAAITRTDAAYIEIITCKIPVITVPFGINPSFYKLNDEIQPYNNVFHLAAMNWIPNEEGVRWFLEKVWPLVLSQKPDLNLKLGGKHMPQWIYSVKSGHIDIVSEVPDSWTFMLQNGLMIVPLFSGSGVRVKIIEGMLAAKAIISTSKGASGIAVTHNENIIIADTPSEFASAVISCFTNPDKAKLLGKNAREFIIKHHNINNIIPHLTEFYKELQD